MNASLKGLLWIVLLALAGTQLAFAERTTTYFHTDGLGSVVAASDQSGAVLWRKSYAPYGQRIGAPPANERLAYTGKPHDEVTGLSYFGGRYYDPAIGRFASVDPVGFVESNPMSFNRYLYVNDNPYKYVDPDGEFLNFAAKFVLDVGINVAFNYATTGEFGVESALKESAVGILNPAKTLAKAGKLVGVLAKASKSTEFGPQVQYHRPCPWALEWAGFCCVFRRHCVSCAEGRQRPDTGRQSFWSKNRRRVHGWQRRQKRASRYDAHHGRNASERKKPRLSKGLCQVRE